MKLINGIPLVFAAAASRNRGGRPSVRPASPRDRAGGGGSGGGGAALISPGAGFIKSRPLSAPATYARRATRFNASMSGEIDRGRPERVPAPASPRCPPLPSSFVAAGTCPGRQSTKKRARYRLADSLMSALIISCCLPRQIGTDSHTDRRDATGYY